MANVENPELLGEQSPTKFQHCTALSSHSGLY